MKLLTTKQVVVRIIIIIALVELLIMLVLKSIAHDLDIYSEAALDTAFLAVLSIPAIYIWVIKPFVDARDEALAQIKNLALTDPLTQLANRRFISTHLKQIIASSVRHKEHGAVLLIDLDGFKPVNDSHGHEIGDDVLVEMAARLQSIVRSEDVVGRLGGDEFVVLVDRLDTDEQVAHNMVLKIAENLLAAVNKPFHISDRILHISASVGIRLLGFDEPDTKIAMSEADSAMYLAKKSGKGRVAFFENETG